MNRIKTYVCGGGDTQHSTIQFVLYCTVFHIKAVNVIHFSFLLQINKTLELVKVIESTGVSAVAVHGRIMIERPQHKNRNHVIKAISEAVTVPVIAKYDMINTQVFKL